MPDPNPTPNDRRLVAEIHLPVAVRTFSTIAAAITVEFPAATVEPQGARYLIWSEPLSPAPGGAQ